MTTESSRIVGPFIKGSLLVPVPGACAGAFAGSVILVCKHSVEEGAVGLVLNRPKPPRMSFRNVCESVSVDLSGVASTERLSGIQVAEGGPFEETRGYVLHSADWHMDETIRIDDRVSLTGTTEIIRAIAYDEGPKNAMIAFGHAFWQPGKLEEELSGPGWFVCPLDEELVYCSDHGTKYRRALSRMGVDPACLVGYHGSA